MQNGQDRPASKGPRLSRLCPSAPIRRRRAGDLLGLLRLAIGRTFFWAFLDKLLALGFATGHDPEPGAVERFEPAAWLEGGSPREGVLSFSLHTKEPFRGWRRSGPRTTPPRRPRDRVHHSPRPRVRAAGRYLGLGAWWENTALVRSHPHSLVQPPRPRSRGRHRSGSGLGGILAQGYALDLMRG